MRPPPATEPPGASTGSRDGSPARVRSGWKDLVVASHAAPTAVVSVLAVAVTVGAGASAPTAALVALAVAAGQVSVGWSNDWLDADRDRAVGRRDKPLVSGSLSRSTLRRAAFAALALCVPASLACGVGPGLAHLAAVGGAWAYNLRLKATAFSPVPYAVSFALLAVFACTAAGQAPPTWALAVAGLLGVGAHLANALPDLDDDVATGVVGLPHRLGRARTARLLPVVLAAAVALAAWFGPRDGLWPVVGVGATATAILAGAWQWRHPASRVPFALSMVVAAACVTLLVGALAT